LKMRNVNQMPVFLEQTAEVIGTVQKVVINDDFKLSYVVIERSDSPPGMILNDDLSLGEETIIIKDLDCIKSYQHGEELSIYDQKLGDVVFDKEGRELGEVSDFIISPRDKTVQGIEVCSGTIGDLLHGRREIELENVCWKNIESVMVSSEGKDVEW